MAQSTLSRQIIRKVQNDGSDATANYNITDIPSGVYRIYLVGSVAGGACVIRFRLVTNGLESGNVLLEDFTDAGGSSGITVDSAADDVFHIRTVNFSSATALSEIAVLDGIQVRIEAGTASAVYIWAVLCPVT